MTFSIKGRNFIQDGKKVFLNSGEIHYFRVRRELWGRHLDEAVKAGLSTISTYIPWAWHESEEGIFDFDGSTSPEKDLEGWLRCCHDRGLNCIVKPGPFILAEFRGAGLPDWFLDRYGEEVRMRNRRGERVMSDGVSLFNEHYLAKVTLWYEKIMPLISRHEKRYGGPVIMMQICNEIGVFSWLARQADYGNSVKERFISFLEERFTSIEEVNKLWGTGYTTFEMIEMPPDGMVPYASAADRGRDNEWHRFWRKYYGDYLRMLTAMARERGVTVPLYHNLPGWIYGSGYEFPVNITMYEDLFDEKSEIIFGVDHIPEYLSYRNMHDDRIINDITGAMQAGGPLFAAEFQSGSREYHVVTNPREMDLFYKASIANGLTGWNYYMFSQGLNPARRGYSGETFYWFTPLTAEGERTSAFASVERMSRMLKVSGPTIVGAERKAEVCVLFYPPYYATELERPAGSSGLTFVPSAIRRPAYFDGLLKVLQVLNIDYDMADLNNATSDSLSHYKQVWAFTTDEMDAPAQQAIIDYVRGGGNVVIYPCLPDRALSGNPCTLIRDVLSASPSGKEVIDSPLIDVLGFRDVKCSNPQMIFSEESLKGSEIIARTISGKPCGFARSLGRGTVFHLGTWIGFDTEGHKPVYEAILGKSGAKLRHASATNEYLTVRERFAGGGNGILFAANYYNEERRGRVTYTHPETGENISLPLSGQEITWPPLYAVLTPLCMEVTEGLKILHSTSDILNVQMRNGEVRIILCGDRDLNGETALEGPLSGRILSAEIEGGPPVNISRESERIALTYGHRHQSEMVLKITISL